MHTKCGQVELSGRLDLNCRQGFQAASSIFRSPTTSEMAKGQGRCCRNEGYATCAQMRVPKPSVRPSCADSFFPPDLPRLHAHSTKAFPFKANELGRRLVGGGTITAEL